MMSEWAWVAAGYGVTLAAIAVYLLLLVRRWSALRRRMGSRR